MMPGKDVIVGCIDLHCAGCQKWMGHLMLENPTDEKIKGIMTTFNQFQLMPICDICSTTESETVQSTRHI
jgi:hypothetical protein